MNASMAIWQIKTDSRDFAYYRKWMKRRSFYAANYFSANGCNLLKMKQLALVGDIDAIRCTLEKSVHWYYLEEKVELARLKGD